jgi:ribosome-associated protein
MSDDSQQPHSPAPDTSREALERDSEVGFFIASGPGGQHRNRNATGVRLVHRPSGIVVTATERRSQAANLEAAFARLARRLEAASVVDAPRVPTRPSRSARVERRDTKRRRGTTKALRGRVREE